MKAPEGGWEVTVMLKYGSVVGKKKKNPNENICRLKFNVHEC